MKEYTVWLEGLPNVTITARTKEDAISKVLEGVKADIEVTEYKGRNK